jgi:acetoin utilization deacetylase AcuC-like enzyme
VTSTAFITHRDCQLHDMGSYHPEAPERLNAISDHLIAQGLDSYFSSITTRRWPLSSSSNACIPRRIWSG